MRYFRTGVLAAVAIVLASQGGAARGQGAFIQLLYCTPWAGCWVGWFYYEQVQVVASYGQLDVISSGWWGYNGGCAECELENPQPPPNPEPVDPGGVNCGDARDTIIQEYRDYGVNLSPPCSYFSQTPSRFVRPEDTHDQWAIVSEGLLGNKLAFIQEYNGCDGDCRVTSGYRCPHNNANAGGATNSRHMYGDAFDVTPRLENWNPPTESKFNQLLDAALQTNPSYITNWSTYPNDRHLHVDWR